MKNFLRFAATLTSICGLLVNTPAQAQQPPCPPLDSTAKWAKVNRAWSNEQGVHWSNDSLRQVLLGLAKRDQAAREDFGARVTDSVYGRQLMALDSTLAAELTAILDRYGLPGRNVVGAKGADAAMLVAQHSASIQPRVLALAKALPRGQISPQALALMEDRILSNSGKSQIYGSQFTLGPDGLFRFAPTADLDGLARRREGAGLPPLDYYVCMLGEMGMKVDQASLPPSFRQR